MRRLAFALLLISTLGSRFASAQTVIVTHAPEGGAIEVVFNTDRVATATADSQGQATLTFGLPGAEAEADVHLSTERCGDIRRVLLVERGVQGPPPTGPCDRRDFPDVFVVQRITTFVVDFANPLPSVHLRQGPAPPSWLSEEAAARARLPPAPKGLIVSGGIGFSSFNNWQDVACGTNTTACTSTGVTRALVGAAAFWLTPNIGAEATYVHPNDTIASGNGDDYTFTSSRHADFALLGAVAGGALGGVRIYGRGGASYHRATMDTTETVTSLGTQSFELKTAGWGWYGGAGVDVWLKSFLAVYADGAFVALRGNAVGGAQGAMDDHLIVATVGVRVHLWR